MLPFSQGTSERRTGSSQPPPCLSAASVTSLYDFNHDLDPKTISFKQTEIFRDDN